jgi:hypothetical protein
MNYTKLDTFISGCFKTVAALVLLASAYILTCIFLSFGV